MRRFIFAVLLPLALVLAGCGMNQGVGSETTFSTKTSYSSDTSAEDCCLDAFSGYYFMHDTVSTIAVINFSTRTIRPLVDTCPWFSSDDYLVDCSFLDDGDIDLAITFRPVRY